MKTKPAEKLPQLRETTPHGNSMFPLMLYDVSPDPSFEERIGCHWHEEVEFLVITKGEASVRLNGSVHPVTKDSICLIPSNQLHLLTCPRGRRLDFFAIVFHPDFLRSPGSDAVQTKYLDPFLSGKAACGIFRPTAAWTCELLQCLQQIRAAFHAKEYAYELFLKIRLLEAFRLLAVHTAYEKPAAEPVPGHHIALAKSMMEYLRTHYDTDVTLLQLEREFNLSKGHICRLFKSMTHMTPFEYLNYYRILQSAALLEHSCDSIGTVAAKSGFNNISYYNRTFRKYMHMNPTDFRKSCGNHNHEK